MGERKPPLTSVGPLNLGSGSMFSRFGMRSISSRFSSLSFFANYRDSGGFITEERPPIGEGGISIHRAPKPPPRRANGTQATRARSSSSDEEGEEEEFDFTKRHPKHDALPGMQPAARSPRRFNGSAVQPENPRQPKPVFTSERLSNIFRRANRLSTMIGEALRAGKLGIPPPRENETEQRGLEERETTTAPTTTPIDQRTRPARGRQGTLDPFGQQKKRSPGVEPSAMSSYQEPGLTGRAPFDLENQNPIFGRPQAAQRTRERQQGSEPDRTRERGRRESAYLSSKLAELRDHPQAKRVAIVLILVIILIFVIVFVTTPKREVVVRGLSASEAPRSLKFDDGGMFSGSVYFAVENPSSDPLAITEFDGRILYQSTDFGLISLTIQPVAMEKLSTSLVEVSVVTKFDSIVQARQFSSTILEDCAGSQQDNVVEFVLDANLRVNNQKPVQVRFKTASACVEPKSTSQPTNAPTLAPVVEDSDR